MATSGNFFSPSSLSNLDQPPPKPLSIHFSIDAFARYPPDLDDSGFITVSSKKSKNRVRYNLNFKPSSSDGCNIPRNSSNLPYKESFPPLKTKSGPSSDLSLMDLDQSRPGFGPVLTGPKHWASNSFKNHNSYISYTEI